VACQDSSVIVDTLLSLYQRKLLEMTYHGDQFNRPKFNVVLAQRIRPRLRAHQFLEPDESGSVNAYQCEITQVGMHTTARARTGAAARWTAC
jgi:hypothetical protein